MSQRLTSEGAVVVRFQFPYMEAKKRRPDPPGVLEAAWRAVIQATRITDVNMVVTHCGLTSTGVSSPYFTR